MIAAIGARTDLSFDAGTGTLTYTGTGSPMPNLVISLAAVNDGLVEGPEQYTVSLSSPGSTTGANVVGSGSVQTTIADVGIATWSLSGDTGVTEGNAASYTVHLDGTLQAGETATVHLALADNSTTSADHGSFTAAVIAAIGARTDLSFDAGTGTLTYTGTGSPMPNLVISLAAVNDGLVEGSEQYTVSLSSPRSTTGANVVGSDGPNHHRRCRHLDLVAQRRPTSSKATRRTTRAPGRHAAGGRDGNRASGAGR